MGDQSFWRLCRVGDIEGVQAAINNGADVNEIDQKTGLGCTGLMNAIVRGHNSLVQLLLQQPKIDINKVNRLGYSALHFAVIEDNDKEMAALLAKRGLVTINQKNIYGRTPIMEAVHCNAVNCFQLLLTDPRVDLDTRDNLQRSPQEPTFEVMEELLEDKTIKFSRLAGQEPALKRIRDELIAYWEEARKGRSIEAFARFTLTL